MSPPSPPESLAPPGPHSVLIRGGSFHLSRELCDTYLSGTESVAAICREGRVMLLPLHGNAAGGSLLKMRNARGDRVVHALEFLRTLGIDTDTPALNVPVRWSTADAGLLLDEFGSVASSTEARP